MMNRFRSIRNSLKDSAKCDNAGMGKHKKIVTGTCPMCLTLDVRLQYSHFLPQAIYKSLRAPSTNANPNPVSMTRYEVKQTSSQRRAYLFCSQCEGRLSRNGENWVLRNALKNDGTFKLRSVLERYRCQLDHSRTAAIYYAAKIPEVDISALTYFATSMFWRGSVYPWNASRTRPVPLGPYEEPLRRFLIGEANFPEDVMLSVSVRIPSQIEKLTLSPMGEWRDLQFFGRFSMPGFAFAIIAGPKIGSELRQFCFVRGEGNPLTLSEKVEQYFLQDFKKLHDGIPVYKRTLARPVGFNERSSDGA